MFILKHFFRIVFYAFHSFIQRENFFQCVQFSRFFFNYSYFAYLFKCVSFYKTLLQITQLYSIVMQFLLKCKVLKSRYQILKKSIFFTNSCNNLSNCAIKIRLMPNGTQISPTIFNYCQKILNFNKSHPSFPKKKNSFLA